MQREFRMNSLPIPPVVFTMTAAAFLIILGIAYMVRAKMIAKDFKLVLTAHRRILIMALVSQGLFYCFIAILVLIASFALPRGVGSRVVVLACAVMLIVLAVVTGSTGGQSEYLLLRSSHFVKIVAAGLILVGNLPD